MRFLAPFLMVLPSRASMINALSKALFSGRRWLLSTLASILSVVAQVYLGSIFGLPGGLSRLSWCGSAYLWKIARLCLREAPRPSPAAKIQAMPAAQSSGAVTLMSPLPRQTSAPTFSASRPTATSKPCKRASGLGGQPGMKTSTGRTWSSLPRTISSSSNTPPSGQAPTATTSFGSGMAA